VYIEFWNFKFQRIANISDQVKFFAIPFHSSLATSFSVSLLLY
jgi:hypothetical protein